MSDNYAHNSIPASKRSPTQRHMHNYSLPSPFCVPLPTTPRPTRCRSSPALSAFRQAVYIPVSSNIHGTDEDPSTDSDPVVASPHHSSRKSPRENGAVQVGRTNAYTTPSPQTVDSGLAYHDISSPTAAHSTTSTPSMRQRNAGYSSLLETPPPPPSSPCRPSTSPARAVNGNLNRLSTASIASLPFPLPIPPGLGSEAEWDIDPFAATPYSFPSGGLQSKWSPDSSTLSLVHHSSPPDAGPKRDQEKQKGDKPQPTKLKELLGRLSINRNPTTSGFHFRSQSANISRDVAVVVTRKQKSRRRDTMMTFDEFIFIDEEDPSSLVEDITARNDGTNILRTPTIRPISCIPEAADQDVRLVDADALRLDTGDEAWHGQVECSVSTTSPTWTDSSPRSTQASIPKYKDVDGIVASQDKSIIASVENTPSCCLDGSISSLSSTMRTPTPNALASYTFSNTPSLKHSRPKPRSAQARTLAIPPSPCAPPPHPPSYLPPLAPDSFPDLDFPSPPTLAQHLTSASPLATGVMEMQRQSVSPPSPSTRRFPPFALSEVSSLQRQKPNSVGDTFSVKKPPAIPPRSKLRPPPVKIPQCQVQFEVLERCDELPLNAASPAHSRSSSMASFRTISPLPTPPMHSRSSSIASLEFANPFESTNLPPRHSHSASVASSDFIISPMPTPPLLSPAAISDFSPSSPPWARPVTPIVTHATHGSRPLIPPNNGRKSNRRESDHEDEMSLVLARLRLQHSDDENEDSSTCTATIPEFAGQEEPRAPPSRLSFYEPTDRRVSSDIEDDALSIYSKFSSTYFRRRSNSTRRRGSVRRIGSMGKGRMRPKTPASMLSVYSQASFCSQDAMDAPSVPTLPGSTGEEDLAENDLGEMVFEAPEYAYAFSWDDYVGHGLEGVALAGRTPTRSGANFEAEPPLSRPKINRYPSPVASSGIGPDDDWRAVLTAQVQDKGKSKRRTSSNISVVENAIPTISEVSAITRPALTDVSSLATNGSISDVSTTSTSAISPPALVPNRRKRTIRHRVGATALSSPHSNLVKDGSSRRQGSSAGDAASRPAKLKDTVAHNESGPGGMKKRASVFKSLVSFALALPRSPSSPTFPSGPPPALPDRRTTPSSSPFRPSPGAHWPSTSISPSVSSSSSGGSANATSLAGSASSSWTPGLANGHALFLSPTATPSKMAG